MTILSVDDIIAEPTPAFIKATLVIQDNPYESAEASDTCELPESYSKVHNHQLLMQHNILTTQSTGEGSPGKPLTSMTAAALIMQNIGNGVSVYGEHNRLIEENIKQLMPNAMKKSRSSSSTTFSLNNNYVKYNLNELK